MWEMSECKLVAKQRGLRIEKNGDTYALYNKDGSRYASNMSYARLQATLKRLDREEMDRLTRESYNKMPKDQLVNTVISLHKQLEAERKYHGK
jgi:hypothetical protein